MSPPPPRRHHFMPLLLQRRFVDDAQKLHVYDKRLKHRGVFSTTPANVFVEKDLNSFQRSDGARDDRLEKWYADLETVTAPIIAKIIDRVQSGKKPDLMRDERAIWDWFSYHLQKRAPRHL